MAYVETQRQDEPVPKSGGSVDPSIGPALEELLGDGAGAREGNGPEGNGAREGNGPEGNGAPEGNGPEGNGPEGNGPHGALMHAAGPATAPTLPALPTGAPGTAAPRRGHLSRAAERWRGQTDNVHAGMRSRMRVVVALTVAAALVVAAVLTTRALAASSATHFPGVLTAASPVQLGFSEPGTIHAVDVAPGQRVTPGQVLATESDAVMSAAVASDDVQLTSDEQRLAALLGPAAAVTQQQAAAAYQKVEKLAAGQEARGATGIAKDESVLAAAQLAVTSWSAQLGADAAAYDARCPTPQTSGCASLHRAVVADQNAVAQAKARVARAQGSLASAQSLDTTLTNLASQEQALAEQDHAAVTATIAVEVSDARDAVAEDEAKLASDMQSLEGTTLTSPVNGVVQSVSGQAGEYVTASGARPASSQPGDGLPGSSGTAGAPTSVTQPSTGQPLITIDATPGLEAVAQVPEQDIMKIAPGQHATVSVDALGGRVYRAVVKLVEPVPVSVDGAVYYDVVLLPAGPPWKGGLLPGMTVDTSLP